MNVLVPAERPIGAPNIRRVVVVAVPMPASPMKMKPPAPSVRFEVTPGSRLTPPATVERLAQAVAALDPFRLAALSPVVTITGSLVLSTIS